MKWFQFDEAAFRHPTDSALACLVPNPSHLTPAMENRMLLGDRCWGHLSKKKSVWLGNYVQKGSYIVAKLCMKTEVVLENIKI